ncbi:MAG TPA: VOC family protein [Patescibacteria group bacterium]
MPTFTLDAYLFFTGNCREAMEFYKEVFGGELSVQTYGAAQSDLPEEMKHMGDKVMHALLNGGLIRLMASDSTRDKFEDSFISLALGGTDEAKLREVFEKLSDGGKVTQPLKKESWGDVFGSLTDKFGVDWMVNISTEKA